MPLNSFRCTDEHPGLWQRPQPKDVLASQSGSPVLLLYFGVPLNARGVLHFLQQDCRIRAGVTGPRKGGVPEPRASIRGSVLRIAVRKSTSTGLVREDERMCEPPPAFPPHSLPSPHIHMHLPEVVDRTSDRELLRVRAGGLSHRRSTPIVRCQVHHRL